MLFGYNFSKSIPGPVYWLDTRENPLGFRRPAAAKMGGEQGITKEAFSCAILHRTSKKITMESTCMPTKCTCASSQEEGIPLYNEKSGSLLFSFSNEYIVPIFPKRIKNMECKYREYSTDEGRIEYRCNGGKNNMKLCEKSNEGHHFCEWCKLQIAMDNFTPTRRRKVPSPPR